MLKLLKYSDEVQTYWDGMNGRNVWRLREIVLIDALIFRIAPLGDRYWKKI